MKAALSNYQQAPRKVRLLADLVRGKKVEEATTILKFTDKKASEAIQKLIASASANAVANFNVPKEELIIKEIRVDKGRVLKRSMPRARGSAFPIRYRSSHVQVMLGRIGEVTSTTKAPALKKAEAVTVETKKSASAPKVKAVRAKKAKTN